MHTDGARRVAQSSWAHLIRQCTSVEEVRHIHRLVAVENTTVDKYLANLLVQMYGSLGSPDESVSMFESTQGRNVFSWNILLRVYAQNGHIQECVTLFQSMPLRDIVSWNSMLQAHAHHLHIQKLIETFQEMPQRDIVSWSSLVTAFAQNGQPDCVSDVLKNMPMWDLVALNSAIPCYDPEEVMELFHTMCVRDSVSWNSVLQTLSGAGLAAQAEYVYLRMPQHNYITWTSMLMAYAATGQVQSAWFMFGDMQQRSVATWNSMIGAFMRNFRLVEVKDVFDKMPFWNVLSWASVIIANALNGHMQQAMDMFNTMPERNHIVWTSMITDSSYSRAFFDRMPCRNRVAWNSMMCVYVQSSRREEAQRLFLDIPERDIVSWNEMIHASGDIYTARLVFDIMPLWNSRSWGTIIQSYVEHGDMLKAKSMFDRAPHEEGTVLGNIMMLGYARTKSTEQAKELFDNSLEHRDSVTWNAMIQIYCNNIDAVNMTSCLERMPTRDMVSFATAMSMYANTHNVHGAKSLFNEMPERDVYIWTSLLNAYAQTGHIEDAKMVLKHMPGWDMASWTAMLGAYALSGHLDVAREMFEEIPEPDGFAYTVMVTAYGKQGLLKEAVSLFHSMSTPGVITYNALLETYSENGYGSEAFKLFVTMDLEGVSPNNVTYTSVFNACADAGVKLLPEGKMVHDILVERCIVNDPLVITAVINFYGKCGLVEDAIGVFMAFNSEGSQCTGLWNAVASVFAWNGQASFTFELMSYMVLEGCIPDANMLLTTLTACNHGGLVSQARDIFRDMLGDHYVVAGVEHYMCIVDVLGRAGQLGKAQELIENMPFESQGIAWTTLLGACKTQGDARRGVFAARNLVVEFDVHEVNPAPKRFQGRRTQRQKVVSDVISALKLCTKARDLSGGKTLHSDAVAANLHTDKYVVSALINMYIRCGSIQSARDVFEGTTNQDVVTWTSLIRGYVENGESSVALELFNSMDCVKDHVTYVAALKACVGRVENGIEIHREIQERGYDSKIVVANTLVYMYGKCGCMHRAREVFDGILHKDVVTWNTMILGYVENGENSVATDLFMCMDCEPDEITYVGALKACADLEKGIALHKETSSRGYLSSVIVRSTVMDMYMRCGSMHHAKEVFDGTLNRDVVMWSSFILGYVENKQASLALVLFNKMDCEPNHVTYIAALKACTTEREGTLIHRHAEERGFTSQVTIVNTLLDMYIKCGSMHSAREVFDGIVCKDVVSYNSLMMGYVENGESSEALDLFMCMECEPDEFTYVAGLKACGSLTALSVGRVMHATLCCRFGVEHNQVVGSALIDMYGKCGSVHTAEVVFNSLHSPNVVSWTSLMTGYTSLQVFRLANKMQEAGVQLNSATFTCLLTACSHSGMVEDGKKYFESMCKYGITPNREHYTCMVDMLGRANRLEEAISIITSMPSFADGVTWKALLAASKKWKNSAVGKVAFDALAHRTQDGAPFVLMGDTLSA